MHIETPPNDKPYDKPEGERRGIVIVKLDEVTYPLIYGWLPIDDCRCA